MAGTGGALAAAALVATPAQATTHNGAQIIRGDENAPGTTCFEALFGFATTLDFIQVNSPSGNVTLTCHFKDVAYPTKKAIKSHNFSCNAFGQITYDTSFVLTPSGQGTLVCKIKH